MSFEEPTASQPDSPGAFQGSAGKPTLPPPGTHVARAGRYFRNVRYIIFVAAFGAGLYFLYDGFIGYPRERDAFRRLDAEIKAAQERGAPYDHLLDEQKRYKNHNDASIMLQRGLGFALPPLALLMLIRWLYISRGEIRIDDDDTLHAPGHPPIPAAAVTAIDDDLWDRKGIAYVEYELPGGASGTVRLDDFVYERTPIDKIHDRLVFRMLPESKRVAIQFATYTEHRSGTSLAEELSSLHVLLEKGILTVEEFGRAKSMFLGAEPSASDRAASEVERLHRLYKSGAISEGEYNIKKWDVLSRTR